VRFYHLLYFIVFILLSSSSSSKPLLSLSLQFLKRCVLTPGDPYMPLTNEKIIERVAKQVIVLSSSRSTLSSISNKVKDALSSSLKQHLP
ncbi:hypothetical protein FRX31_032653, partial [Thalictrum thalictroides]